MKKLLMKLRRLKIKAHYNNSKTAPRELKIPRAIFHNVLHKILRMFAYKVHIFQALKSEDLPEHAIEILDWIDNGPNYLHNIILIDESIFLISVMVN